MKGGKSLTKMSTLSEAIAELRRCGDSLVEISHSLQMLFHENDEPTAPDGQTAEKTTRNQETQTKAKGGKKAGADQAETQKAVPAQADSQPVEPAQPAVTLEQVRTVLAEKSIAGHRAEVQALIHACGAEKLSAVDPQMYADLLEKAEVL